MRISGIAEGETIPVIDPKIALLEGAEEITRLLGPRGFRFQFGEEGNGSGGAFAWGEFVREDRRLELHFRHSLGMIRYHAGNYNASHKTYMQELGVRDRCHYPGISEDPIVAFHDLAHDLGFAEDFVSGSAVVLQKAAAKEMLETANYSAQLMAGYTGDTRFLGEMKDRFREQRYGDALRLAAKLTYPERMTPSERRMVEIARERSSTERSRWKQFFHLR
jgi:hypothetical protein